MNDELLTVLQDIAQSLRTIAAYVEILRKEKTGEREFTVNSYVLGTTSNGDLCVFLYADHPGLEYRVAVVYQEQFALLPFVPDREGVKLFSGQAPKRSVAAQQGYLNQIAPFRVLLRNVGDEENPRYRLAEILPVRKTEQQAPPKAPAKPVAGSRANGQVRRRPDRTKADDFDSLPPAPQSRLAAWRSWKKPADAQQWAIQQGFFADGNAVRSYYHRLKKDFLAQNPQGKAQEFFQYFYDSVLNLV